MRRRAAGTTLLELLIAMTVLGVVVAGLFSAFVFGGRVAAASGGRLAALALAQQTMEDLRDEVATPRLTAGPHDDPPTAWGALAPFGPARRYIVRNGKFDADGNVTWTGTDTDYDLKEVRVEVEWTPPPKS